MDKHLLLCPSMMCANLGNLDKEVAELEAAGVDMFHLDVMDGHFVPNYALALEDVRAICKAASVPCDVHLMATNAADVFVLFVEAGVRIVYIHPEIDPTCATTLDRIKKAGAAPAIAINPGTSIATVEELLPLVDYVLVMTVNPGFAGQKYQAYVEPKIKKLAELAKVHDFKVMIDGSCSPEVIARTAELGADGHILGTSALFRKAEPYAELITNLRNL